MKIKESEIKNILYPLNNCSKCSYTRYYVVFHGSLDWGLKVCVNVVSMSLPMLYLRFCLCYIYVCVYVVSIFVSMLYRIFRKIPLVSNWRRLFSAHEIVY